MMTLDRIMLEQLDSIYKQHLIYDFPESEMKPLKQIESYMKDDIYEIYVLRDAEELYAYALFMKNKNTNYQLMDYFASNRNYRNMGYGSKMLQIIKQDQPGINGILFEVETVRTASNEQERVLRERRIAFYLRNGLRKTKIRTIVYGNEFDILYMPILQDVDDNRLFEELRNIYLQMFGKDIFRKLITMEKLE